ncbi:MAG TPA: diaminopimelate decarboxylase [Sulfuricaulis sp.]|nr:diaminopimelate decarboxylase [Sulfuricaulis sp.]
MNPFAYQDRQLYAENVRLAEVADKVGTPCYVYSRAAIEERFRAFDSALAGRDHLVCYAVKANSNLAVLDLLVRLGSGFDIVSGGELERVLAAGGDPAKVVFSGVGKTPEEMRRALAAGIHCFNMESEAELEILNDVAGRLGRPAPVALRVNPDVDPATHPYIATGLKQSKFGIDIARAGAAYMRAQSLPNLRIVGIACHIGSQLTDMAPLLEALDRVTGLAGTLLDSGVALQHLDLGGGLGIRYNEERPPEPADYVRAILDRLQSKDARCQKLRLIFEPGRAIVGNAGLLLTRVLFLKLGEERNFAVVDAAMNDLLRPALYDAWHDITPVAVDQPRSLRTYDIVGPVCESGDFLGRDRALGIEAGDLLAVVSAGAYGAVMSSNYNTRPRAPEVMVDGNRFHVVRRRETVAELMAPESLLPGKK